MTDPPKNRSLTKENASLGLILLAAGAARRMQAPKQLLRFEGETLLRRAALTAAESIYRPVVVVLGANFEQTKAEIEDLPLEIVFNEDWAQGLSSSIKLGLENLLRIAPDLSAALVTLADLPFVGAAHLNKFAETFQTSDDLIVAAEYHETIGVPALFAREVFPAFASLSGDRGARRLFEKYRARLSTISLPEAAFDIDTPADFVNLKSVS